MAGEVGCVGERGNRDFLTKRYSDTKDLDCCFLIVVGLGWFSGRFVSRIPLSDLASKLILSP